MMAAILQFEIDRERVRRYPRDSSTSEGNPVWKYERLLSAAMYDTLANGGTFVLVVAPDKITAIQREDVEAFEP
jgi:hypothetical protein